MFQIAQQSQNSMSGDAFDLLAKITSSLTTFGDSLYLNIPQYTFGSLIYTPLVCSLIYAPLVRSLIYAPLVCSLIYAPLVCTLVYTHL